MTWETAILGVMGKRPSHDWTLTEIYAAIDRLPIVTPHHRELWGSQPNFHHWVRSAIARLRDKVASNRSREQPIGSRVGVCQVNNRGRLRTFAVSLETRRHVGKRRLTSQGRVAGWRPPLLLPCYQGMVARPAAVKLSEL